MQTSELSARERILSAALDLFYRDGIRATGVDRLIAESGVAKLTFYRHFPSKEALVLAFLEQRHERWMAWFSEALERLGSKKPRDLRALADVLAEWFEREEFRGCAFINTTVEVAQSLPEALPLCQSHKTDMAATIARWLGTGGRTLADAAALAFDGGIVQAQMAADAEGRSAVLRSLRRVLAALQAR
ncbi:TetR/AcrR family transcriptional regulator [Burkholderiaceae bacterium UC74_6]